MVCYARRQAALEKKGGEFNEDLSHQLYSFTLCVSLWTYLSDFDCQH